MATPEFIALKDDNARAGTILMWALHGTTNLSALTVAWDEAGLRTVDLPEEPSPSTALRRSVNELRAKHRLVRPLKGDGYAIVEERAEDDDLSFEVTCKAKLDKVGRLTIHGADVETFSAITEAFNRHMAELSTEDVSAWLVGLVEGLDGVALRESGGVYFIPRNRREELDRIVSALKASTSHAVYRIPCMHGEDAVELILDAIQAEVSAEADAMQADIASDKYGARAYENRLARCDAVEAKAMRYESLLGAKLEGFRERIEQLRANLTVALVKAQQGDEQQSLASL